MQTKMNCNFGLSFDGCPKLGEALVSARPLLRDKQFKIQLVMKKTFGFLLVLFLIQLINPVVAKADEKVRENIIYYDEVNDPLEPFNRAMFGLNLALDKLFLKPISMIYRTVIPMPVRNAIRNVFRNVDTPKTFVHDLLQGEGRRALESAERFGINSTVGLLGTLDVAAGKDRLDLRSGIPYHKEDFGQTMAVWGIEEGIYIFLPIIGPSNIRDLLGKVGDTLIDPTAIFVNNEYHMTSTIIRRGGKTIDLRSRNIETLDDIERDSIDYYATVRSLYRQHRRSEIANGKIPKNPLPSLSDNFQIDVEDEKVDSGKDKMSSK